MRPSAIYAALLGLIGLGGGGGPAEMVRRVVIPPTMPDVGAWTPNCAPTFHRRKRGRVRSTPIARRAYPGDQRSRKRTSRRRKARARSPVACRPRCPWVLEAVVYEPRSTAIALRVYACGRCEATCRVRGERHPNSRRRRTRGGWRW